MKDLLDRILSSPMILLLLLGIVCLAMGAGGGFELGSFSLKFETSPGKLLLEVSGVVLILAGLFALWVNLTKDQSFGYAYGWGIRPNVIHCSGSLRDSYLMSLKDIHGMPAERVWKYELSEIVIKQYPKNVRLDFNVQVTYHTKAEGTDTFHCTGFGPFDGKVAYIKYGFYNDEKKLSNPQWSGVLVLRIPKSGNLHGIWLSASANKDNTFPLGTLNLRKLPANNR